MTDIVTCFLIGVSWGWMIVASYGSIVRRKRERADARRSAAINQAIKQEIDRVRKRIAQANNLTGAGSTWTSQLGGYGGLLSSGTQSSWVSTYKSSGMSLPTTKVAPDDTITDVEIGRHALRTFRVDTVMKELRAIYFGSNNDWEGGKIEATCRAGERIGTALQDPHDPPGAGCTCGAYGTVNLRKLMDQYSRQAFHSIAVMAAEGATVIGPSGLRTAAARIVAYWCDDDLAATYEHQCKDAKRYTDIPQMLKDFDFPPDDDMVEIIKNSGSLLRGIPIRRPRVSGVTSGATFTNSVSSPADKQVLRDKLLKLMLESGTPGGIQAVKGLLGDG